MLLYPFFFCLSQTVFYTFILYIQYADFNHYMFKKSLLQQLLQVKYIKR